MNDNHNRYSASDLEKIISIVRAQNGKASCRLVAERIGRSVSNTWQLLMSSGLPTRLYSESLQRIEERIRTEEQALTLTQLYERFGSTWANPDSFYHFLNVRGIQPVRESRSSQTPRTPDASLFLSKLTRVHPIFGREGFLDDTKKTDVELRHEAKIRSEQINNNPVLLYKKSYESNKHKLS